MMVMLKPTHLCFIFLKTDQVEYSRTRAKSHHWALQGRAPMTRAQTCHPYPRRAFFCWCIKRLTHLNDIEIKVFFMWHGRFLLRKIYITVTIFFSATCVMRQGQNDINFQCHIVFICLANCPRYTVAWKWTDIRFVCIGLRTVSGACALRVYTKESVYPCIRFPQRCPKVCVHPNAYFLFLSWCIRMSNKD